MEDFSLEAKICGLFKRRRLEMGMGNKSRERHDFLIFIFMESFVWMRQGAYRSVQFLKDSNRHNTSCALIMRFHNFKNCWMNEFTRWFIHHLFSPLTYIRFGGAFLGVWVLDRQILTMKNFSFLKTLLLVCGVGSLPTQGGIRHPARLKVFHAHGFRVPGAPVLLFYHSLLSAPEGNSLADCDAGAGICGLHLTLRQKSPWRCVTLCEKPFPFLSLLS